MEWEYEFITGTLEGDNLIQQLNSLGKEGWEAVGFTEVPDAEADGLTVLLKRERQPERQTRASRG